MGEIADALRRAKIERQRLAGRPAEPRAAEPALPTGVREAVHEAVQSSMRDVPWGETATAVTLSRSGRGNAVARATLDQDESPLSQSYRHLALRLRRALEGRGRSVLVTSALPREGKTTSACNLALALASLAAEQRTALVDLDLRRPTVGSALGVEPRVGIERVLAGGATLAAACLRTDLPGLDLYLTARPTRDAHSLLVDAALPALLEELEHHYDLVVIDAPPVLLVPDVALIAARVGSCVAVVRSGETRQADFRELQALLPPGVLVGVLLNMTAQPHHKRRYGGYYHVEAEPARAGGKGAAS